MSKWLFSINMEASTFATVKCLEEELYDADLRNDMYGDESKKPASSNISWHR
jgi:hypothetical protein